MSAQQNQLWVYLARRVRRPGSRGNTVVRGEGDAGQPSVMPALANESSAHQLQPALRPRQLTTKRIRDIQVATVGVTPSGWATRWSRRRRIKAGSDESGARWHGQALHGLRFGRPPAMPLSRPTRRRVDRAADPDCSPPIDPFDDRAALPRLSAPGARLGTVDPASGEGSRSM